MGARDAPEHENGNTLRYRVGKLEEELERQRERIHALAAEHAALRLLMQRVSDQIEHLDERSEMDVRSVKRALYTFMFSVSGAVIVFALSVFTILGRG